MNVRQPRIRRLLACACLAIWLSTEVTNALEAADSPDERFVAGLRERELFDLAAMHCRQELASPTLPDDRRAVLVIELARVYAEQAVQASIEERDALWKQAHEVAAEFLAANSNNNPRHLLVQLQGALVELAHGELARQDAATLVDSSEQLTEAKTHLRNALSQLETVRRAIDERLRRQPLSATPGKDDLTRVELEALAKNVAFQLARAARNQAECYPAHSPDRANSLTHALERFGPLAELAVADDLVWRSRIEQAVCYRLLRDHPGAKAALESVAKNDPPPQIALRARAETIRLLLAQKSFAEVAAQLEPTNSIAGQTSLDLDFARFEAQLALATAASNAGRTDEATKWRQATLDHAQSVGKTRGAIWSRRAEMLLASTNGEPAADESVPARQAAQLYQDGKLDEAVAAYDRAAKQARDAEQTREEFALAMAAAAIEEERGRLDASRDRYRTLALREPSDPRAGEAHLLATYAAATLARSASKSEQAARVESYAQHLTEHLEHWPRGTTADRARLMLGELRSAQHRWEYAVEALVHVNQAEPEFLPALRVMFAAYQHWLAELPTEGEQLATLAEAAAKFFERVAESGQDDESRASAAFAARLRLGRLTNGYAGAACVLTAALTKSDDAPQLWQSEARALLVIALAGEGKLSDASTQLEQLASAPSEQLVELIGELARLTQRADPARRHELGGLTLRGISLLDKQGENLPPESQAVVDNAKVAALIAAGHGREAVRALDELAKKNPLIGQQCETRARLLADMDDRTSLARALAEWRAIERQCRAGSPRWFRARWGQADVYRRQALPEQAIRLIRLTAALYPELGGAELKARFDQLQLACEQAR